MATITTPQLEILQAQPGFSKIQVVYLVTFDNKDLAVNQPYNDRVHLIGDDTNIGDPAAAGGDDKIPPPMSFGTIRPDMAPFPGTLLPRVHEWTVPTSSLDEDQAPIPNPDEVRAVVTLTPLAPKVVGPVESNVVKMLI
jgi:hypothetical protein